jgi:hypothetical protein
MAPHHQKAGYFDQSRTKDKPPVSGLDTDWHTNCSAVLAVTVVTPQRRPSMSGRAVDHLVTG